MGDLVATSTDDYPPTRLSPTGCRTPFRSSCRLALRYLDDLSFAEIAEILGCPESTARSHVHRALARLRTELEADHER